MSDILKILKFPDTRLSLKAAPVEVFDWEIDNIVKNMFITLYKKNGLGLAAIQVNIQKSIIVIDVSENKKAPLTLINPTIISTAGEDLMDEGCLSFPGVYTKIKRALNVKVRFFDKSGYIQELDADGLLAHCIQHEIDHLNGVTFYDRVSKLKQDVIKKKMEKYAILHNKYA